MSSLHPILHMIIDTHTHIFNEETYREYQTKTKGLVKQMIAIHYWSIFDQDCNINRFELDELLKFSENKEDLSVIASFDMDKEAASQLNKLEQLLKTKQIVGIKMYPGYQHFYPSDDRIDPIAELCQSHNVPIVFHSGDVYDFEKKALLKYSQPLHIDELAVRFPKCKIIIAHFGFPSLMQAANIISKNKNVFTDISGTIDKPETKHDGEMLVKQYIADLERVFAYFPNIKQKVMFGTDFAGEKTELNQIEPYIQVVEAVFSKEERQIAFHDLAEGLFF